MYYMYVTNKNAQLFSLDLTYEAVATTTVATPVISPVNGTEFGDEGLNVTITCETTGASIYYTLNGNTPDNQSTLYNGAISLTETTTVKAIAYDGTNYSNVATATYTYVDPNAPGSVNNPYTVAQAIANTPSSGNVYIQGIVSSFYNTSIVGDGTNYRYYISDDGSTTTQLLVYKGKGLNQATFTSADDLLVGDEVVIYGTLTMYNSAPEINSGNYLYSWNRPAVAVEAPVFSPVAGTYYVAQNVTLSCETQGATIYYTTDGSTPDSNSTQYTSAISVSSTTTIKAIAYVGTDASAVATATYTIVEPYTVTFNAGNGTCSVPYTTVIPETSITLPTATPSAVCDEAGWTFAGWATANVNETTTAPTLLVGSYTVSDDVTLYAVYVYREAGGTAFDNTVGGEFSIYALVEGVEHYAKGTGQKIESTTSLEEATIYTFEKPQDYGTGEYAIKTGTTYLTYASSTNLGTSSNPYKWTITQATKGSWRISSGTSGRAMIYREDTEVFGGYSTGNVTTNSEYYDLEIGGSSTATYATNPGCTKTYTLPITAYSASKDHYYLIASPVQEDITPAVENGFITSAYDLYMFDQAGDGQGNEWINYELNGGAFTLVNGMGYLYASSTNTTLTFTGTPVVGPTVSVSLVKDDDAEFPGWNLVGNPFAGPATIGRDFYTINNQTNELMQNSGEIAMMNGVFVIAANNDEELIFTAVSGTGTAQAGEDKLVLNLTQGRGLIDRAVVRFGEGRTLPKFQLNPDNTKIYITEGNQDYAVVRSNNAGEMPVSFKAAENGNYTLSVEAENVEASYLHLIDNMTGADVDLLATPSYSFEARTTDYANRFRLVFNANGVNENNATASFAYFNGSGWTVSNMGEATLQVVDMMGRVVSTQAISGNTEVNLNQASGVYMLRLVNGENVMVQKVVVK